MTDTEKQNFIKFGTLTLVLLVAISLGAILMSWVSPNNSCAYSPYQHLYNNATGSVLRWFGECHTTSDFFYKSEVDCRGGFLGIGQSCVVRDHYELGSHNVCYKLKTGEFC